MSAGQGDTQLPPVLASLSLAMDMANGNPQETALRTTVLAWMIGREAGLNRRSMQDLWYVSLLRFLGCTAYAHEEALMLGGDDIGARRLFAPLDLADKSAAAGAAIRGLGKGKGVRRRSGAVMNVLLRSDGMLERMARSTCEVAAGLGHRLGMSPDVIQAINHTHERYDGKGYPQGVKGGALSPVMRIVHAAYLTELVAQTSGASTMTIMKILRSRAKKQLDPEICAYTGKVLGDYMPLRAGSVWDIAIAQAPRGRARVSAFAAASAFADFSDMKSTFRLGHSRRVHQIVSNAAEIFGLSSRVAQDAGLAALTHDIGLVSVSTGILEKKGPLNPIESDRIRLHSYYSERILEKSPLFARAAVIAGFHHERGNGSGYFRNSKDKDIPQAARLLAAADCCAAMASKRAHRPAFSAHDVREKLLEEVREGRLDSSAVRAVLEADGAQAPAARKRNPGGLSEREVEVLRMVASGRTNREIAGDLKISARTVQHHTIHIYDKLGVSNRASAALFAAENGIV